MSGYTQNLNLILPTKEENYDVETANTNNKIIDDSLGNKVNKIEGKDLSSNDFTNNYKKKLDTLQNIYKFIGTVDTIEQLPNSNNKSGDVYNVKNENKDYAWSEETKEWLELGSATNIDNIIMYEYKLVLSANINAGGEVTLPCKYKVGTKVLQVYFCGEKLLLSSDDSGTDGHYREVGSSGSISNKIKLTTDWSAEKGDYFEFVVRGEYYAA